MSYVQRTPINGFSGRSRLIDLSPYNHFSSQLGSRASFPKYTEKAF